MTGIGTTTPIAIATAIGIATTDIGMIGIPIGTVIMPGIITTLGIATVTGIVIEMRTAIGTTTMDAIAAGTNMIAITMTMTTTEITTIVVDVPAQVLMLSRW